MIQTTQSELFFLHIDAINIQLSSSFLIWYWVIWIIRCIAVQLRYWSLICGWSSSCSCVPILDAIYPLLPLRLEHFIIISKHVKCSLGCQLSWYEILPWDDLFLLQECSVGITTYFCLIKSVDMLNPPLSSWNLDTGLSRHNICSLDQS